MKNPQTKKKNRRSHRFHELCLLYKIEYQEEEERYDLNYIYISKNWGKDEVAQLLVNEKLGFFWFSLGDNRSLSL